MPTDTSVFLSTAGSAAGMAFVIEGLKRSRWFPWITTETAVLNRWLGILSAGLITVGIHVTWTETTGDADTSGLLVFAIPTLSSFGHNVWTWFTTWALQEYTYRVAAKQ